MTSFVSVVNDVLSIDGILFGDDDAVTSFSDSQHVASIRLAKSSVQQELAALTSDQLIPYERADAILTASSRLTSLASDFVRFQDERPWLVKTDAAGTSSGSYIAENPGGEERLRKTDINYRENTGEPYYWYWPGGQTKQIGLYLVPNTTYYYRYYYEKDVSVTNESDTVPFVTATEVNTFVELAARRFKYLRSSPTLREQLFPQGMANDPVMLEARSKMTQLLRYKPPAQRYGRRFI